jgi:Cu/Ag efflux pump CusA
VRVKDIGSVQMGGDLRLGILMQMEGEVVGIVVMRYGENADIDAVKLKKSRKGLLKG